MVFRFKSATLLDLIFVPFYLIFNSGWFIQKMKFSVCPLIWISICSLMCALFLDVWLQILRLCPSPDRVICWSIYVYNSSIFWKSSESIKIIFFSLDCKDKFWLSDFLIFTFHDEGSSIFSSSSWSSELRRPWSWYLLLIEEIFLNLLGIFAAHHYR